VGELSGSRLASFTGEGVVGWLGFLRNGGWDAQAVVGDLVHFGCSGELRRRWVATWGTDCGCRGWVWDDVDCVGQFDFDGFKQRRAEEDAWKVWMGFVVVVFVVVMVFCTASQARFSGRDKEGLD